MENTLATEYAEEIEALKVVDIDFRKEPFL